MLSGFKSAWIILFSCRNPTACIICLLISLMWCNGRNRTDESHIIADPKVAPNLSNTRYTLSGVAKQSLIRAKRAIDDAGKCANLNRFRTSCLHASSESSVPFLDMILIATTELLAV
ncbi:hypothetical protein C8J57DRAFT_1407245 [Mycena rebaudengoi]|nr:hypothetical protein C8J57DRAFT_1407245 [Mycena rebaudengoi]